MNEPEISLRFLGIWNPDQLYEPGDFVIWDNVTWITRDDCQGREPGNSLTWIELILP